MKRDPRKSSDEKQETELVIKLNDKVVCEKVMTRNLTMSDTIVLAALTMCLRVSSVATLIVSDNPQPKPNTNEGNDV